MNKNLIKSFQNRNKQQDKDDLFNHMWRRTPEQALEYFNKKQKNIKITGSWKQLSSAEHQRCFTVANVTNARLLQTILDNLIKCKKDGLSIKEFKDNLKPALEKNGWLYDEKTNPEGFRLSRLTTIYNTNMNVAYAQGRWNQQTATAEDTGNVYWQYKQEQRATKRHDHAKWHNRVFRYDDPIWNTIYPPSAFNCNCRVVAWDEEQIKKQNLKVETGQNFRVINDERNPIQISSKYEPDLSTLDPKLANLVNQSINNVEFKFDKYDFVNDIKENTYINQNYNSLSKNIKGIVDDINEINNNILIDDADLYKIKELNNLIKNNNFVTSKNLVLFYGECYYNDELPKHCKDIIAGKRNITFETFNNLNLSRHSSYKANVFIPYKTDLYDDKNLIKFFYEFYLNENTNYLPNGNNDLIINNNNTFSVFDNIKTGNTYLIRLHK